jgi:carbonic anhydrase
MSIQKENSKVHKEVIEANAQYVKSFGEKGNLALPPARRFAILTCMDARLDPAKYAGLSEGDAHVIRNAGGRASDDAIRSLVISHKLLGTQEFFVIHHSDCGMQLFTDDIIRNLLEKSLKTATIDANGWKNVTEEGGSEEARFVPFLTFKSLEDSVVEDVKRIRNHPLVPKDIPVYGYYYDVKTGKLVEVEKATNIGRAV